MTRVTILIIRFKPFFLRENEVDIMIFIAVCLYTR